jgi:pimeloyl-ACP methyl ester carboxylesterase
MVSAVCLGVLNGFPVLLAAPGPAANTAPPAKTAAKKDMSKAEPHELTARDGLPVHIIYWGSESGQESPVVIHLHGKGGSFRDFPTSFVELLHRAGYAQVLVDLRGHGQSKGAGLTPEEKKDPTIQRLESGKLKSSDFNDMVTLDLEAVKQFIYQEHQGHFLNMNRTGIVAVEMSTPIAAAFALGDWEKLPYEDSPDVRFQTPRGQDVHSLVLISPVSKTGDLVLSSPLTTLREPEFGISFLLAYGQSDRLDKGTTEKVSKVLNPGDRHKDRVSVLKLDLPLRGSELLGSKTGVDQKIVAFLNQHLKMSGNEWRDRQSRLDKKKP